MSAAPLQAAVLPFLTTESSQYLLIGMGSSSTVGQAVNVNNFELGANKAPVPSTSGFLSGGSSGGPGLLGNVPNIPLVAKPVGSGILGGGNVAITHLNGVFNLQNVGVYGNLGVRTARAANLADVGTSNSFYNDPNHFPNTFNPSGFANPGVNNNTGGTGVFVGPGQAVQSTRMDAPVRAGVTGSINFSSMQAELANARTVIPTLAQTATLNVSGTGGQIQNQTRVVNLASGLNVIDIVTGGSDFKLDNSSLVIDGPSDAIAIFRVPNHANFLISNGNVLIGNGGIGGESVLFYSARPDNAGHFNFNNAILNNVAFWSLGGTGGEIVINNAQGCMQLIADKINLNDVRFNRCSFTLIPEPGALSLAAIGLGGLALKRRR
jgi:hypothetical protein